MSTGSTESIDSATKLAIRAYFNARHQRLFCDELDDAVKSLSSIYSTDDESIKVRAILIVASQVQLTVALNTAGLWSVDRDVRLSHHFDGNGDRVSLARSSNLADVLMDIAEIHTELLRSDIDQGVRAVNLIPNPTSCLKHYINMIRGYAEINAWYGSLSVQEVL